MFRLNRSELRLLVSSIIIGRYDNFYSFLFITLKVSEIYYLCQDVLCIFFKCHAALPLKKKTAEEETKYSPRKKKTCMRGNVISDV